MRKAFHISRALETFNWDVKLFETLFKYLAPVPNNGITVRIA